MPVFEPPTAPRAFSRQSQWCVRPFLSTRAKIIFGFLLFLLLFILGIVCTVTYTDSFEVEVRYDELCPVSDALCKVTIPISRTISGNISVSYKLTKFYQNHRRFVYSRSAEQLYGAYVPYEDLENCKPYRSVNDDPAPENWILPSGAFAHWVFNDTFYWYGDRGFTSDYLEIFDEWKVTYDSEWAWTYQALNEEYTTGIKWLRNNTVFQWCATWPEADPHFIRWMRTEAASTFVKEYNKCWDCTIKEGEYDVWIISRYPTTSFGGTKSILVTELTPLGDRSLYLGVALLVVSVIVLGFTIGFLVAEFVCPRNRMTVAGSFDPVDFDQRETPTAVN